MSTATPPHIGRGYRRRQRPQVVLSDLVGEPLLQAIMERARAFEWEILDLQFCGGELLPGSHPQGAIVGHLPGHKLVRELRKMGCPVVRLGRLPHPRDHEVPVVMEDMRAAGRQAAEHFAERGFRNVGYVGHDPWSDAKPLYAGFVTRARELGCRCHLLRFASSQAEHPESDGARFRRRQGLFAEWVAEIPKPLGLLGYSDSMAGRLCSMCAVAGLAVPEQVAVLGRGNNRVTCECAPLTLSSIDHDPSRMGTAAAQLLRGLMAGKPIPDAPVMVPSRGVVVRESTDALATPDPDVAQALRYIWDNLDLDLCVDDIAAQVAVSRRKLERAFRRELGRGINEELLRKRLELCCELLRTTEVSITDLAPTIGFKSKDYLHRAFRRHFGQSPRQYRLQHRDLAARS